MTNEQAAENLYAYLKVADGDYDNEQKYVKNRNKINKYRKAFLAGCSFVEEKSICEEDRDIFAISFAIWVLYNQDAQALIAARVPAYQLLEKYKDRPYIDPNVSHQ